MKALMAPPPPPPRNHDHNPNPNLSDANPVSDPSCNPSSGDPNPLEGARTASGEEESEANDQTDADKEEPGNPTPKCSTSLPEVPYSIPPWSEPPGHPFYLEVLKDGAIIQQLDVSKKGAYMFGRIDLCDFVLEHPTISRYHAVLQFKKDGEALLYDLGSTHGTSVNKTLVKKRVYKVVHVGDVIRFGQSSRLYIFQGPSELMPPEGDIKRLKDANFRAEMQDREASLLRARVEASLVDGISWGMAEDAIEEAIENDADEITWQTYKGQLTERQEKTRGKIIKRMEKVANMKKEIEAIRVKDIPQGGLTQGQQTQIARNEQRISQFMEELESLEETLNESIQESLGARVGKVVHKKGAVDDEDELVSDDDEFYDRTKKNPSLTKSGEQQSVETADTLLDKKENIIKVMEDKANLLSKERNKMVAKMDGSTEVGDTLDAYMTGLSSQLVLNTTAQIEKELSGLQSELDRILYLLKIADPTGEAARKRDAKAQAFKANQTDTSFPDIFKQPLSEEKKTSASDKSSTVSARLEEVPSSVRNKSLEEDKDDVADKESKTPAFTMMKPKWLGAVKNMESVENKPQEDVLDANETHQFVDYKDRKKILAVVDDGQDIEHAAPGLIIRKRKHTEEPGTTSDGVSVSSSSQAETTAADAVALLLKHKRGYFAVEDEVRDDDQQTQVQAQPCKENPQSRRVLGPERPAFLSSSPDYESWVPPEGQSGDGRTSLNDRLGY